MQFCKIAIASRKRSKCLLDVAEHNKPSIRDRTEPFGIPRKETETDIISNYGEILIC